MKKKKEKSAKRQEMPEFSFKEFSPEEDKIYEEAVAKFREALAAGRTLRQAYESYSIADTGLRSIIQADFLKIVIAESHFGKRQTLEELSRSLDVSHDLLKDTLARMLQEVGISAAGQFVEETGGLAPKPND